MTKPSAILIIANEGKDGAQTTADEIAAYARSEGCEVQIFSYSGVATNVDLDRTPDLAITLGGDGTVLFASRVLSPYDVPILPINLGTFGFISEISHGEWRGALEAYRAGRLGIGERMVLDVRVERDDRIAYEFRGLNDAVIASGGIARMVELAVSLGSHAVGIYRADGIIVATPTGSTAYSIAAGGPILHPEMDAIILNPVSPFTLSHRPIVLPPDEVVGIDVLPGQRTDVALTVDGQTLTALRVGDRIIVRRSQSRARIVRSDRRTFYQVLRQKLNWAGSATRDDADD